MRWNHLLPMAAATALAAATCAIVDRLQHLGDGSDVDFDTLLAGDLHRLYLSPSTWMAAPTAVCMPDNWVAVLGPGVALVMAPMLALIWWWARRAPATRGMVAAWLCLAASVPPWLYGRVRVGHEVLPNAVGPWLAWMLGALLCGCVAAVGAASWAGLAARERGDAPSPAVAH